jgi:hypothetical protein
MVTGTHNKYDGGILSQAGARARAFLLKDLAGKQALKKLVLSIDKPSGPTR